MKLLRNEAQKPIVTPNTYETYQWNTGDKLEDFSQFVGLITGSKVKPVSYAERKRRQ